MPLKSAYLLPHSPLLIPEIGKANREFFDKTISAYQQVIEEIKSAKIDILIILSPHASHDNNSFQINVAPEMEIDLKEFGFIPPKTIFHGASILADKITEELKDSFPLKLSSESILDYGSAVPVYLFKQAGINPKILTISTANDVESENQLNFGKALAKIIRKSEKNISIIASGDLSHKLEKKSPGGYSGKATKFDNKLIEIISEQNADCTKILNIDKKLAQEVVECALSPVTILMGILSELWFEREILAYQTEFGVGYLSAKFEIKE